MVKNLVEKKGEFCELWLLWWEEESGGGGGSVGFGGFVGLVVLDFGDFLLVGCGDLKGCWRDLVGEVVDFCKKKGVVEVGRRKKVEVVVVVMVILVRFGEVEDVVEWFF